MTTLTEIETPAPVGVDAGGRGRGSDDDRARLGLPSVAGLGVSTLWLSLLVLIPLAAVVVKAFGGGWAGFWHAVTTEHALASLRLTVICSVSITVINAVMGTVIAWVLVRDDFRGKRLLEIVIDIPFALPTIVAGLVLISVYGPQSPIHLDIYGTQVAVAFALLFVTLPFVARAVQPVLQELDLEAEQAAECLGAGRLTVFRRIVLPQLLPAVASGSGLGFARAMGEFGSVLLISGGLDRTEVTSLYAYGRIQNYDFVGAAAVSTVLLLISLAVLLGLDVLQRKGQRRG